MIDKIYGYVEVPKRPWWSFFIKVQKMGPYFWKYDVTRCLFYHHIITPHNISLRVTLCVFLAYPYHHQGFGCLKLTIMHIFIYRHVRFSKTIFLFSSITLNNPPYYTFLNTIDEPNNFNIYALRSLASHPPYNISI